MNAMLSAHLPLPAVLDGTVQPRSHRRHHIDPVDLTEAEVGTFNRVLVRLGRSAPPLDCDQLVTAARELCTGPLNVQTPPCIRQRLFRVKAAACMAADRGWRADEATKLGMRLVVEYVRGRDDLIPDEVPRFGRLDDAIVVDAYWPSIADEVADFLDFCRLRHAVALRRGRPDPGFDRAAWRTARDEEAALMLQLGRIRQSSYVPSVAPRFLVH